MHDGATWTFGAACARERAWYFEPTFSAVAASLQRFTPDGATAERP